MENSNQPPADASADPSQEPQDKSVLEAAIEGQQPEGDEEASAHYLPSNNA